MRVISAPLGLRLASGVLLLSTVLAAVETAIISRAPIWRLPTRKMAIAVLVTAVIFVPLRRWLLSGKGWPYIVIVTLLATWNLLTAWVAVRMHYPSLGFFTVFQLLFFFGISLWLKHELGRSFFDPRMSWYQGLPRSIPGIKCYVSRNDAKAECAVSRLDREGAFVFRRDGQGADGQLADLRPNDLSEMTFVFRDRQIKCKGAPMLLLDNGMGAGFQFKDISADLAKELGDFMETLRGEGYVE